MGVFNNLMNNLKNNMPTSQKGQEEEINKENAKNTLIAQNKQATLNALSQPNGVQQ